METPSSWIVSGPMWMLLLRLKIIAVIRDSSGKTVAAATKSFKYHYNVAFAEVKVIEWGIGKAKETDLSRVIFKKKNCQVVANLANNRKGNWTEIYWVVFEIQDRRKERFSNCSDTIHSANP